MSKKTCIITINYNNSKDTLEMIESIINNLSNVELIVIDNNSEISQLNFLIKAIEYPYNYVEYKGGDYVVVNTLNEALITIIKSDFNGGFSFGNNIGINYANNNLDCYYYWFLNNDIVIKNDALQPLIKFSMNNKDNIALASTILEYYSPTKIQCGGGVVFNKYTTRSKYNYAGELIENIERLTDTKEFDFILGCSMFIAKKIINKIDGFSTDYFLYFEELDIAQKLKKINVKQAWVKESYVYHKGGNSIGSKSINHNKSFFSEYHEDISCLIYLKKFQNSSFLFTAVNRYILKLIKKSINRDVIGIKALNKAYADFFINGEKI